MSFGPFAYSSDGTALRAVDAAYQAQPDEIIFADYATPEQLTAAFPNYAMALAAEAAAAEPKPSPRQWLERLAPATQAAITRAAVVDTTGALLLWLMKAAGNGAPIDVAAQETKDGVAALEAAGVITAADAATLLAP